MKNSNVVFDAFKELTVTDYLGICVGFSVVVATIISLIVVFG